jgi:hypothetical protein
MCAQAAAARSSVAPLPPRVVPPAARCVAKLTLRLGKRARGGPAAAAAFADNASSDEGDATAWGSAPVPRQRRTVRVRARALPCALSPVHTLLQQQKQQACLPSLLQRLPLSPSPPARPLASASGGSGDSCSDMAPLLLAASYAVAAHNAALGQGSSRLTGVHASLARTSDASSDARAPAVKPDAASPAHGASMLPTVSLARYSWAAGVRSAAGPMQLAAICD